MQGEELLTKYSDNGTRSGYTLERYFCKTCGSNVFLQPLRPEVVEKNLRVIALGSLDGPLDWSEFIEAEVILRDVQLLKSPSSACERVFPRKPCAVCGHKNRGEENETLKFVCAQTGTRQTEDQLVAISNYCAINL